MVLDLNIVTICLRWVCVPVQYAWRMVYESSAVRRRNHIADTLCRNVEWKTEGKVNISLYLLCYCLVLYRFFSHIKNVIRKTTRLQGRIQIMMASVCRADRSTHDDAQVHFYGRYVNWIFVQETDRLIFPKRSRNIYEYKSMGFCSIFYVMQVRTQHYLGNRYRTITELTRDCSKAIQTI